ncbi:MAG TPA: hypothetical protein VE644_08335, partial [Gaiellaceae bacterium]|nr:hypothetical protein [Gaiellaceae bacterium]
MPWSREDLDERVETLADAHEGREFVEAVSRFAEEERKGVRAHRYAPFCASIAAPSAGSPRRSGCSSNAYLTIER